MLKAKLHTATAAASTRRWSALARATTTAFCILGAPAPHAQTYFNNFHGGCPGANYRKTLITKNLIGTWHSSGEQEEVFGAIVHYTSASTGDDRVTHCNGCCKKTYEYDATIRFSHLDAFGNIVGRYETIISQAKVEPDPAYLARHDLVYRVDCGAPPSSSAGTASVGFEVRSLQAEHGLCELSPMVLIYNGEDNGTFINMTGPQSFRRSDDRIYRKE